ncbi:MAG TPA: di-heme enzyme [Vicinamibacterales bacterium]|nr:di-heme enzyme [Vicinamibacterales bacterium]
MGLKATAVVALALAAAVVLRAGTGQTSTPYDWRLPSWLQPPPVPADNPMSVAKVALGRHLFYDKRLSGNGRQSCASCHQQDKAFTDGLALGVGSTGQRHPRGSMSLVNVGYAVTLTWNNPRTRLLEDQALVPMYGDHPVELGLDRGNKWMQAIEQDRSYRSMFSSAFPGEPVSAPNVVKALAAFERSIVSMRSPYDRYHFGHDDAAVGEAAKRGEVLFFSARVACFSCHGGKHFSLDMGREGYLPPPVFHNTGLYNLAGQYSYPASNLGLYESTKDPRDVGKFKPPTLRNIEVTAPYMHDGSVATLEEAIDHYAAGGRTIFKGPYAGIGRDNPNKSAPLRGFPLTPADRADLIEFLKALTDVELLRDPRFSDPRARK